MNGMIIAIEGIDGSGKHTQSKLLAELLSKDGHDVFLVGFPRYQATFFGKQVANYLNGVFGSLDEVDPRLASMLYAGDRFETKEVILENLSKGKVIVIDRYTSSNIAHQSAKVAEESRDSLMSWIQELEHTVFGLPKPDLNILLSLTTKSASTLVLNKSAREYTDLKKDIHEQDDLYLEKVSNVYKELARQDGWITINCNNSVEIRNISDISNEIYQKVSLFIGDNK